MKDGGDKGDRTPDLVAASDALSQLSYDPVKIGTIDNFDGIIHYYFTKTQFTK